MSESFEGANPHEQLLAAARGDNDYLLSEALEAGQSWSEFDINHKGPLGNTALHLAAQHRSLDVLDILIDYPGCIVNPTNNNGDTPLHLAVRLSEDELNDLDEEDATRLDVVDALLEKMMEDKVNLGEKNKNGDLATDLIRDNDKLLQQIFKRNRNQQAIKRSVRNEDYADDDDDEEEEEGGSESD